MKVEMHSMHLAYPHCLLCRLLLVYPFTITQLNLAVEQDWKIVNL